MKAKRFSEHNGQAAGISISSLESIALTISASIQLCIFLLTIRACNLRAHAYIPIYQKRETKMDKFTVISGSGVVQAEGLSEYEAAVQVLTHDGHNYEIRPSDIGGGGGGGGGFWLWHTQRGGGGNVPMVRTLIYSAAETEAEAQDKIFAEVLAKADWFDHQDVMTDAAYAAMVAEIEAA